MKVYEQPVGSVTGSFGEEKIYEGTTDVVGKYGRTRHTGVFSANNPALTQLSVASSNQDKDALYEKAVNWELDQAKLQQELDVIEYQKQEQRFYDSPEQQILRERIAGRNPDLVTGSGSSGSGSSGGSIPLPTFSQTPAQTKFSNAYDNANTAINAVNAASSFFGSLSSLGQVGINMAKDISTWGDMLSQSSSASQIAEKNVELASDQVDIAKLNKSALSLDNLTSSLSLVPRLKEMFGAETADADIISGLKNLGYQDADNFAPLLSEYGKNPNLQAYFQNVEYNRKVSQARNESAVFDQIKETFSNNALGDMYESRSRKTMSEFKSNVDKIFATLENAQSVADTMTDQVQLENVSTESSLYQLEYEFEGLKTRVSQLVDIYNDALQQVSIYESAYAENPTAANKALLDSARTLEMRLNGSTVQTLYEMYDYADQLSSLDLAKAEFVDDNGKPFMAMGTFKGRFVDFNNFLFPKLYNAQNGTLDMMPAVTALIAAVLARGKGLKPGITQSSPGSTWSINATR